MWRLQGGAWLRRRADVWAYRTVRKMVERKENPLKVWKQVRLIKRSIVNGLDEGFEETLVLHRLGLFQELGISAETMNCIESFMTLIGDVTHNGDYWRNRDQKH
jgi:hypothetical protein